MSRESPVPRARLWLAIVLVTAIAAGASAAGISMRATYGAQLTADEPQYLLTAISIAEDRSLDISDELAAERYRPFHEVPLPQQTKPRADGSHMSPHDPLLPAVLAAPVAIGGWVAAKATLAAIAGLLAGLLLWTAVRRFGVSLATATLTTLVFGASAPFAVYGTQVYPELPAAFVVTLAITALTGRLKRNGTALLAAAVVALPWLATKYLPVALVLAIAGLTRLLHRGQRREALALGMGLGLAAAAFLAVHQAWYGGWTPYASGDHFVGGELTVIGSDPNYAGRGRRLSGLLVGEKFGLAAWQPAWLFVVPAVAVLLGRRPHGWDVLCLTLVSGWLTATFLALTMHGWWWPGRQLVIVLPAAVIGIAWWTGTSRARRLAVGAFAAVGMLGYGWLLSEGLRGQLTWVVDFYETSNPIYRIWARALPDYLDQPATMWPLHWLWVAVIAATALAAFAVCRRQRGLAVGSSGAAYAVPFLLGAAALGARLARLARSPLGAQR